MEDWKELVTWKQYAVHLHNVINVLNIDKKGKILVECHESALTVVDGRTGRIFCHNLVCGGTGGAPGGIGCLFNYSVRKLIFWSSANLPELVVSRVAHDEALGKEQVRL